MLSPGKIGGSRAAWGMSRGHLFDMSFHIELQFQVVATVVVALALSGVALRYLVVAARHRRSADSDEDHGS
jgi:hypothetical protein